MPWTDMQLKQQYEKLLAGRKQGEGPSREMQMIWQEEWIRCGFRCQICTNLKCLCEPQLTFRVNPSMTCKTCISSCYLDCSCTDEFHHWRARRQLGITPEIWARIANLETRVLPDLNKPTLFNPNQPFYKFRVSPRERTPASSNDRSNSSAEPSSASPIATIKHHQSLEAQIAESGGKLSRSNRDTELERVRLQVETAHLSLTARSEEISECCALLDSSNSGLSDAHATISRLEAEFTLRTKELDQCRMQLSELQQKHSDTQKKLDQLSDEHDELQDQFGRHLVQHAGEIARLRDQLSAKDSELLRSRFELVTSQKKLLVAEQKLIGVEGDLEESIRMRSTQSLTIADLEKKLADRNEQMARSTEAYRTLSNLVGRHMAITKLPT